MSTTTACFENIIGLSRTPCPCVEDAPEGANVSASGLYLDELDGLNIRLLDAAKDCGQGTLWEMLERARANAIEETKAEIMAGLSNETDPRRQSGTAQVGSDQKLTADSYKLGQPYHGMTLQVAKVKGGTFRVTAIATCFKADSLPGTIEVKVYDRFQGEIASYVLPCTANTPVWTEITPLELSMDELGTVPSRYWFLYEPVAGMRSMNSLINCGCGYYAPEWNEAMPNYLSSANQKGGSLWAEWCMAGGISGSDLAGRETWMVTNQTNGLILRVEFDCDQSSVFCADVPNYTTDPIQKVIAHAVRLKAGANLVTNLLSSTSINRHTMTAGDVLTKNRSRYAKEWLDRITGYVVPRLAEPGMLNRYSDCLRCKDKWGMSRGTIRS